MTSSMLSLDPSRIIGKGKYSTVYACEAGSSTSPSTAIAVKIAARRYPSSPSWRMLKKEIDILDDLDHPHIICKLQEPTGTPASPMQEPRLFTPLYDCTLEDLLIGTTEDPVPLEPAISRSVRVLFAQQILSALAYLEAQGICHMDVKPENFLVDRASQTAVLADFGFAERLSDTNNSVEQIQGSPLYLAPERMSGYSIGTPADLYAGALSIWGVLTGKRLFPEHRVYHKFKEAILVAKLRPSRPATDVCSEAWWRLLTECWEQSPTARPSASDAYARSLVMTLQVE